MTFELKIIALMFRNPEIITAITISANDLSSPRLGKIFNTVRQSVIEKVTPDFEVIIQKMDSITGESWSDEVMACALEPANPSLLESYEKIILDKKRERELHLIANRFQQAVCDSDPSAAAEVVESIKLLETSKGNEIVGMDEIADKIVNYVADVESGVIESGLTTGVSMLDKFIGGLTAGDQIIIAARTSVGKTAFMVNLAESINAPCLVISAEQGDRQIGSRVMAKIAGISAHRLNTGHLSAEESKNLLPASQRLKKSQIKVVDKPRVSIDEIERLARAAHWKFGIKALFIDYLQLISSSNFKDNKRLQISDISARGKALAKELDIPVIMLAQLNRNADGRAPRMADLKESGSIEEDADVIVLLSRDEERPHEMDVDVQKNRNGPTGYFQVGWNAEFMAITNIENRNDY